MSVAPVATRTFDKLRGSAAIIKSEHETTYQFQDGEVDFDQDEADLLRDLLSGLTEASPSEFHAIGELKALLNP